LKIVELFDSYAEVSVSGTGVHIFCRGEIPDGKGHRRGRIEIYDRSRYFTVTGCAYGKPRQMRDAQSEIAKLLAWIIRKRGEEKSERPVVKPVYSPRSRPLIYDDHKLLHRAASAKNGYKFARLWRGDTSDYGGDDSRADVALLSLLLFWTQGDVPRADALFRQSGLCRDKWLRREDYRARCFDFCLRGRAI
jgi:putative DNA primase/helicase